MTFLYSVIASVIGAILLFSGIYVFRLAIIISGFISGAFSSYWVIMHACLQEAPVMKMFIEDKQLLDWVMKVAPVVGGVLGAILCFSMWKFSLFLMGASGAYIAASLALLGTMEYHLGFGNLFDPTMISWVVQTIISSVAFAGGVLALMFERPIIIISTSCIGALLLASGLDLFLETGFDPLLLELALFGGSDLKKDIFTRIQDRTMFMALGWSLTSMIGICAQYAIFGRRYIKASRMRQYSKI